MSEINSNTNDSNFGLSTGVEFDLGLLISIIKRSWMWVVMILGISGSVAYTYIHYTPPVGLVTDGIASLKLADYPIYVFRSEYSKKSFIDNINLIFIENKITNLSAVLNSVDLNRARYGSYGRG